jgi:RND family efflux transporter MFP subunit
VGIASRLSSESKLKKTTEENAVPTVATVKAKPGAASEEIVLPGTVTAWHDAPIYARTNGYVMSWKYDIGTPVKSGEVLAEIDTPEVDAQLHQAQADLQTAQANSNLAQSTAERWKALLALDSVTKQETDEKVSNAAAMAAALAAARANVERLQKMEGFKHVTAPFKGVITARNTDVGALINAGSGTPAQELFHIAQTDKLRIYVDVPETYASAITPDLTAELHFSEHPGEVFPATLAHTADALDPTSRTLQVQFEAPNTDNRLLAGGFTEVHMKVATPVSNVRLPVNTLLFRAQGLQVATVDAAGAVQLKSVNIARDFGNEVEINSGVAPNEQIIVNPPDSLENGEKVKIVEPTEGKKDQKPDDKNNAKPDEKTDAKKDDQKS